MKSLPINIEDSAKSAIDNYNNESCKCVFLTLDVTTQAISGEEKKVDKLEEIRNLLTETDPRYILFWYSKSKETGGDEEKEQLGNKRIFGYYCPEKANRKLRFTYSTCKANVMQYCHDNGIKFYSKVECTQISDFKEEYMDYHIFPMKDKKETFAMPKAPKSRRRSKTKKRKKVNLDDLQ